MIPPAPPVLIIVGPTAVGKTLLSLNLAEQFNGEILSADSRLFYRGLDIGTAKPTPEQQARVPHHFIDICDPNETLSLGQYQRLIYPTTHDVLSHSRLPIVVGGTGQYVMAFVEGWGIPEVPPQPELRQALNRFDAPELARWLAILDPAAGARIDPRNKRRVLRALEVILVTGRTMTALQRKQPPPYDFQLIGLRRNRKDLYRRIDQRVEEMMSKGLLEEVSALRARGYDSRLPSMSGLGYRQLLAHLEGKSSLGEAVERIKFETHRFARHQATWFRDDDPRINWFDLSNQDESAVYQDMAAFVEQWLDGNINWPAGQQAV